jgi:hypothetical protein
VNKIAVVVAETLEWQQAATQNIAQNIFDRHAAHLKAAAGGDANWHRGKTAP